MEKAVEKNYYCQILHGNGYYHLQGMENIGKIHNLMITETESWYLHGARDPKVLRKSHFRTKNLSELMKSIINH